MNAIDSTIIATIARRRELYTILAEDTADLQVMVAATVALEMLSQAEAWVTLMWTRALEIEADAAAIVARAQESTGRLVSGVAA